MRSIVRGMIVVAIGCAGLRGATASAFRTVYVPADFATIQEAVDAVGRYGTVDVAAGSFGPVTIGRESGRWSHDGGLSDLTIRGGRDSVIDGGAEPAITIVDSARIVVSGFSVVSQGVGVSVVRGTDITVRNITVRSAGLDGIRADTVNDVTVTGNRVESAGGTGIQVRATTSEIYGPLTVTSNTVLAAGGDGILVHNLGDGADMIVTDNVVASAGGRGIVTECGMTLELARNAVSETGGSAVSVYQLGSTATVTQNEIADSGGTGIEISNAPHIVVSDNSIERTAGDGVTLGAPDVHIDRNTIVDAGGAGIRVGQAAVFAYPNIPTPGGDPSVSDNVITGAAGTGIVLDHARPLDVTGNSVTDAGVHGIELDGSRGSRLTGNEVTGAGSCGFRLDNGARNNVLAGNTAMDCSPGLWARGLAKKNRIAKSNHFGRRRARR